MHLSNSLVLLDALEKHQWPKMTHNSSDSEGHGGKGLWDGVHPRKKESRGSKDNVSAPTALPHL